MYNIIKWGHPNVLILMHCWQQCKLVQSLWKTVWKFFKKLKIQVMLDPIIPLLGIYLMEMKTGHWIVICTPILIEALFTIAKIWTPPECPCISEWIKNMWYVHHGLLLCHWKKKESCRLWQHGRTLRLLC